MESSGTPRNRKERRAATSNKKPASIRDIPLAQPSREGPKHKTLYEIAAERQAEFSKGQPFEPSSSLSSNGTDEPTIISTTINPDGSLSNEPQPAPDEPIGPFGQAVFSALTLTMLHFTLDVLVHHQYRQAETIEWSMIVQRALITFPILVVLIFALKSRVSALWAQLFFFVMSVAAGCYLIYSSNEEAYFAVMKRAPPLGTLWVWSVIEMKLEIAVGSLLAVVAYFWWGNYSIF